MLQNLMVQLYDVLFSNRTRIAWCADIVDGLFCQCCDIGFLDAQVSEALVCANLCTQLLKISLNTCNNLRQIIFIHSKWIKVKVYLMFSNGKFFTGAGPVKNLLTLGRAKAPSFHIPQ